MSDQVKIEAIKGLMDNRKILTERIAGASPSWDIYPELIRTCTLQVNKIDEQVLSLCEPTPIQIKV